MIVAPIVTFIVVAAIGSAVHPLLLKHHPQWLLAMDPRTRWVILVANRLQFWPLLVIVTTRRLVTKPLYYLLGRLYGDGAVRWAERRFDSNTGIIRKVEHLFATAGPVIVFLFPMSLVCVLAGAAEMPALLFGGLALVGTITMVSLLYVFAGAIRGPVDAINRFYSHNFRWLTAVSVLATALWLWSQARKRGSELGSISQLENELGDQPVSE
jgi:membrane protein DedA with SNARE-associated domain